MTLLRSLTRLLLLASLACSLAGPARATTQTLTVVDPEGGGGGGGGGGSAPVTTQTLTILGASGPAGTTEPNTDYSKDGGVTWHPAYLFTGHPWGYIAGTNAWLNQDPSPFVGLNDRVDFRIRFYLPATYTNPTMTYQVNADNEADILLNGTLLVHTVGGSISSGSLPTQYLVPGINIVYVRLIDYGGWVGLNYRLNLTVQADAPIQLLTPPPSITSALTAAGTVGNAFSYTTTATNSPTSFAASNLPAGLGINTANGVISGTPTAAGSYNVLLTASSNFGSGSNTLVLTIGKGAATVTLGSLAHTYDGAVKSATATTSPSGLPVSFTYTGASVPPVNAGNYTAFGVINHANYTGSASGTLVIAKAPVAITLGNLAQAHDGSSKPVTVTTSPTGVALTVTYNGSTTAPSAVGSYAVAAQSANANYIGSATGTLVISDVTKPVLSLPANIVVEATSAAGAAVTFSATANDAVSGSLPVTLTPASGTTFPIGLTTVNASATDAAGNIATGTFTVKVHALTIGVDKPIVTVNEGATATNSGSFNDSDSVAVTVSASKGTATQTASGVWNYQQTIAVGGHPIELSLDTDENIYVANEATVLKYNAAGTLVTSWSVGGARGIAVDNVNHVVYVTANANSRIEKYSLDGVLLSTIGTFGTGDGQLRGIYCVAVDTAGNVYVTDTGNARIQVFSPSGTFLRKWGTAGSGDGQFNFNQGIRISSTGKVYVADRNNQRIQYFDLNGNFLGKWGSGGSGDGQFNQPAGVGIDPSGNVYVGDIHNHRVQKFTATGTFVDKFGPGSGAGALNQPHGTAFADAGRSVYVASWANGNIVKYTTPGTWSWSYTAPLGSVGTSVVTATATNANGIVKSVPFDLVVLDATPPVISMPANQIYEATSPAGAVATFAATASDAITASPTITYSRASGSTFALGTTVVTVTATDLAGNVATATFTVTVLDTIAPVIVPLSDIVAEATGATGAVVTFGTTASDIVSATVAVAGTPASGSTFPLGPTTVTLTAVDAAGNPATSTFTVTVRDTTKPVITQANLVLEATSPAGAVVMFAPIAIDLVSGNVTVSSSLASGSTFPVGTTAVTLTATDAAGNVATATFSVTVTDTTAPVIAAQDDLVVEATSAAGAVATFAPAAADIVSGAVSVTATPASGSTFALGTTTVALATQDAAGNTAASSFTVTVVDTTAPTIATPAAITAEATGAAGAVVAFSSTATDLVDGTDSVSASPASGSTFALGKTTVTLTSTDVHGNTATSSFDVTVVDTTAPVIAVPADLVLEATSAAGAVASFTTTASDLVDGSDPVTFGPASGSTFALGTTTVTASATDAAGNTSSATFTVTVRDTTAPAITVPAAIVAEATSANGAAVSFSASAADLVDSSSTVSYGTAPGSTFALGTSNVTVTSTDSVGNTSSAIFTITVVDTTAPVISVPANLTVEATSAAGAAATFSASAADAVGATVAYSAVPGSTFAIGTTTVTVTSTDAAGNIAAPQTFTVTVRDTTKPVLAAPANIVAEATSAAGAAVNFAASVTDAVGATIAYSKAPGSVFPLGTTTVTVTATDAAGNAAAPKTFTVTVRDTSGPVLTFANLVAEATCDDGARVTFAVSAVDLVSGVRPVTVSRLSGSMFPIGVTTVTVTSRDALGNLSTGTFTVTVRDTTAPVLRLPANITAKAKSAAGAKVEFRARATDLVDDRVTIVYSKASGSTFPLGVTVVTVTATDDYGNVSTGTFTVTVVDKTKPVFTKLTVNPSLLLNGTHQMVPVTVTAIAKDAVDTAVDVRIVSVSSDEAITGTGPGDVGPDWQITGALTLNLRNELDPRGNGRIYTIVVTATDDAGNTRTQSLHVLVGKKSSTRFEDCDDHHRSERERCEDEDRDHHGRDRGDDDDRDDDRHDDDHD